MVGNQQQEMSFVKVKSASMQLPMVAAGHNGLWISGDSRQGHLGHGQGDRHNQEDLCASIRIFLRFGRLLGILPVDGVFSKNACTENLKHRKCGLASIHNKLVALLLCVNVCVGMGNMFVSKKETASELAFSCSMAFFYFMGAFTYIYFGANCSKFLNLLTKWKHMKRLYFSAHPMSDVNLFRDANLVAGILFTSAILENALLFCLQSQIISIPYDDEVTRLASPRMETYYRNSHTEWVNMVYDKTHTTTAIYLGYILCACNKFAVYAWNYADTMIIILSRAMYHKFKVLVKVAEDRLLQATGSPTSKGVTVSGDKDDDECGRAEWEQLTTDHSTLCELLAELAKFLSPLVFTCFATNIFFICIQIKSGLTSSNRVNFMSSFYFVWSLIHLLLRVFLVCVSAARISDHAHSVRKLYHECPGSAYTLAVQRADDFLGSSTLGLDGLNCFVITKPFILTVIGVVFTLEIVLLTSLTN